MQQNRMFKTKMPAAAFIAALVLGLSLAGCTNPMQEVEGTVNTNAQAIASPAVSAEAVSGGVRLAWPPIMEASGYEVWRSGGGVENPLRLNGYPSQDSATGTFVYLDLAGSNNTLAAATQYTYTVKALPSSSVLKGSAWTGKVTTTTIPARGDQAAKPGAVAITVSETGVEVSITPGTVGPAPEYYSAALYRKSASGTWSYATDSYGSPVSGSINGTSGKLTANGLSDGEYAVWVYGEVNGGYYAPSDVTKSEPKTLTVLLSSGSYPAVNDTYEIPTPAAAGTRLDTLSGYEADISLNGITFKEGVTYSVERAAVDADGVVDTYAVVQLKRWNSTTSAYENINFADFLPDFLGHPGASPSGIDTSLPAVSGTYQYRLKAVKGSDTAYGTDSNYSRATATPRQQIRGTIEVSDFAVSGTNRTYQVKPYITADSYKNALQTGDKLVVYWISSPSTNGYQTGPWAATQSLEFSKTELEADAPAAKTLTIPYTAGNSAFAQAYLVYADGTREDVRLASSSGNFTWDYSGSPSGAYGGGGSYYVSSGGNSVSHYYVQLFYPTALSANAWADGFIGSGGNVYYTLSVTNGTTYYVWWNDSSDGDGTQSLNVKASALYQDGSSIFTNVDNSYNSPQSFTASQTGTVTIRVQEYYSYYSGTYRIVYSNAATRPQ